MNRFISFCYGVFAYLAFISISLHLFLFAGNLVFTRSIDFGREDPVIRSVFIDLLLISLFGLQHSIMARPWFKDRWKKIAPEHIERSTFVLVSSLLLGLMIWQWRPVTVVVWDVENPIGCFLLYGLFWIGWILVVGATFMIDHFELFGLRQVYTRFRGREFKSVDFNTPALYKYIRHPIMLGFIIAFWATPTMTVGHLVFSIATTVYILIALQLEERDLENIHGKGYENYKKRVSMLLPFSWKG